MHAHLLLTKKIKELEENQSLGERLKYELSDFYSLHFKKYRIVYFIRNGNIIIAYIGLRKKIYDDMKKKLKQIFKQIKSENLE